MGGVHLLLAVVLLAMGSGGGPNPSKLDPLVRRAVARASAGISAAQPEGRMSVTPQGDLDVFIRGTVSRQELEAAGARVRTALPGLYTAFVPVDRLSAVAALSGVVRISGSAPVEPELDLSVPATGVSALRGPGPAFAGLNGAGVLVGSVDSGVDYGHGDFDDSLGHTRFVRIWDQTSGVGSPPTGFGYGTEWTSAQIDANQSTEIDDIGHGTHVMGIAAGDGSQTGNGMPAYTYVGMAPRADLVTVRSSFNTSDILDGVNYIFGLATARGEDAVVNLSIGSQFGPHDGTDDFESGLSAMTGPGRIIVKSAGNDRGTARHAEVQAAGLGTDVTMSVSGSVTGGIIAIDGYYNSTENLSVQIRTPNGTVIGPIARGNLNAAYPGTATANGRVYLENGFAATAGGSYEVYVELNVENAGQSVNGTWTFTFTPVALGAAQGEVDLWRFYTSSTAMSADFVSGNQPDQELISEPGNAQELITVGAWVTKQTWIGCNGTLASFIGLPAVGNLADFSSPGPTRDGRQKPDIAAPGAAIASATSYDTAPLCPGAGASQYLGDSLSHVVNEGTSMAAPHVAGAAALLMQSYGAMTPDEVKSYLSDHAKVDAFTGAVWNKDWGNGKLFLDQTSATLLGLFQANPVNSGVEVRWQLSDPRQFSSVVLERSESQDGPWAALAVELRQEGDVTVATDMSAELGRTYFYRLVAQSTTGQTYTFGPLQATAGVAVATFELLPVAPNPTSGSARIDYTVPWPSQVRVSILDVQGREVATLDQGMRQPGRYQAVWTGEGDGHLVAPGLYFVRLKTAGLSLMRRLVVTR